MTPSSSPHPDRIYLDHNATSPIAASVRAKVPEWMERWGNPSSIHQAGRGPKTLMRESRESVARFLGVNALEVIFTSGGSEANNLALKGVFESFRTPEQYGRKFRNRYLVSSVEHPSVKRTAEYLRSRGAEVEFIPVARSGAIDLESYKRLLTDDTALVSMMLANNETGVVYPIKEMAELAHERGALFHADCVQALGKLDLQLPELGVDLATISGHKFYSLKGVGVLFAKRGVQLESLIHGGGQERHRRGGTENLLAIASLAHMCEKKNEVNLHANQMIELRDHFESRVLAEITDVSITAKSQPRLPNTSSLLIPGADGEILLMNLDLRGFAVSTGAACSSGSPEPSPVLLAMGLTRAEAQSSLRVGLGWSTTRAEIDRFVDTLKIVVKHLRAIDSADRAPKPLGSVDGQRKENSHVEI